MSIFLVEGVYFLLGKSFTDSISTCVVGMSWNMPALAGLALADFWTMS